MALNFSINGEQVVCKRQCEIIKYACYLIYGFFLNKGKIARGKVLILLENDYLCNIE